MVSLALILATGYNLRLMYHYVWNTGSVWAWDDLRIRLHQLGILYYEQESYTFRHDFENHTLSLRMATTELYQRSMYRSGVTDTRYDTCILFDNRPALILKKPVRKVELSLWLRPLTGKKLPEVTILVVGEDDHIWLRRSAEKCPSGHEDDSWIRFTGNLTLLQWMSDPEYRFAVMLTGTKGNSTFVDDLMLRFR